MKWQTVLALLFGFCILTAWAVDVEVENDEDFEDFEDVDEYDEEMEEEEEGGWYFGHHPYVQSKYKFINSPEDRLVLGEEVEVLIHLSHVGDEDSVSLLGVRGVLTPTVNDASYIVQNFTAKRLEGKLTPGNEMSLHYSFTPDAMLEPRDFGLILLLNYYNSDINFTVPIFNSTVEIHEGGEPTDMGTLLIYTGACVAVCAISYSVYICVTKPKKATSHTVTVSNKNGKVKKEEKVVAWDEGDDFMNTLSSTKKRGRKA
eukprot:GCRY01000706.1.p1 GENE.GCRY01000706.1~~GCRY01000706.1.p1  ORF type:complete len:259 (-),score=42.86 GCRY01000706.1:73-849(-)